MKRIKFSIIIPIYNMERYLQDALDSVAAQSYPYFEVVLVDDCSDDDSKKICREYCLSDSRFRLIAHEVNQGVSAARNSGMAEANGDYVLFMDPDDTWQDDLLEKVEASLLANPVDYLVFGFSEQYYKADMEFDHESKINIVTEEKNIADVTELHKITMKLEAATMLGYPWNKVYRRELLHEYYVSFPEGQSFGEDIMFNADFLDHVATMTILPDFLYNYRNFVKKRLTSGVVDDYFEIQKKRVARLHDQQSKWHTLDDEGLEILARIYFRSFQSMIIRCLEARMSTSEIRDKCKAEEKNVLFKILAEHLPEGGTSVKLLYRPIAEKKFVKAIHRGRQIIFFKKHFGSNYNKYKRAR